MKIAQQPTAEQRLKTRERPKGKKPVMYQEWRDLLFLHWTYPAEEIQKRLPEGLFVDTYEGNAYIGLVPFFMVNIRPTWFPPVPFVSNFLETNLRTYVHDRHGNPGVWFFSLDANQWLAVQVARKTYNLPYFYARMNSKKLGEKVIYSTKRRGKQKDYSLFTYEPKGHERVAKENTLLFFLAERYLLFSYHQKLYTGQVVHNPYPLWEVEVGDYDDTIFTLNGLQAPKRKPDHAVMSKGVEVDVYAIEPVT